jgi:hypothetical protein
MAHHIQMLENERLPQGVCYVGTNDDEASSTRDSVVIESTPNNNEPTDTVSSECIPWNASTDNDATETNND